MVEPNIILLIGTNSVPGIIVYTRNQGVWA